jgi:hypothetical protein
MGRFDTFKEASFVALLKMANICQVFTTHLLFIFIEIKDSGACYYVLII